MDEASVQTPENPGQRSESAPKQTVVLSLKARRERAGLSLRSGAAKVGVHHRTLGRFEDGETEPSATVIGKMAEAYGCSVEAIVRSVTTYLKK